jgi:ribonuclease HI
MYIDNATAVKTTYNISLSSGQWIGKIIRKGIDEWLESEEGHKIRVAWIPAHMGIRGNKEADKLAKSAYSKSDRFKNPQEHSHYAQLQRKT